MPRLATIKASFFDREAVVSVADRFTSKSLSRFGAFTMTRIRRSLRARKGVSEPGSPPSVHGSIYRKSILFYYDRARKSVVIGPYQFNGNRSTPVPELLESGGSVRRGDRILVYRPRPHINPAFEAELAAKDYLK
jgi:hypothetical protein